MKLIRKIMSVAISAILLTGLASCSAGTRNETVASTLANASEHSASATNKETSEVSDTGKENPFGKALVVYFSCTGTTKDVALKIASEAKCSACEIEPVKPYTADDLNYNTKKSRAYKEQNDASARPEISGSVSDWDSYDTIFIGYPVWYSKAPRILCTFVENYDFSGKTVIPFCTSGSSGIGSSATELAELAKQGKWINGTRFAASVNSKDISEWLNALNGSI